jgi:hypothetical protein
VDRCIVLNLYHGAEFLSTQFVGGWEGLRTGLSILETRKIFCPYRASKRIEIISISL